MRLFGEKIDRKVKYQRRVGAYGIIIHKNELLLTEQIISENNIEVQLPGGGSNKGESLIQTLYREVLEETGWGIKVLKKMGYSNVLHTCLNIKFGLTKSAMFINASQLLERQKY